MSINNNMNNELIIVETFVGAGGAYLGFKIRTALNLYW